MGAVLTAGLTSKIGAGLEEAVVLGAVLTEGSTSMLVAGIVATARVGARSAGLVLSFESVVPPMLADVSLAKHTVVADGMD